MKRKCIAKNGTQVTHLSKQTDSAITINNYDHFKGYLKSSGMGSSNWYGHLFTWLLSEEKTYTIFFFSLVPLWLLF